MTETATQILATRAVLSGVTISVWGAATLDRKVTAETLRANGAHADAGKFTKQLVPRLAVEPLQKAASDIRRLHYKATLPWTDEGLRVLPVANANGYHAELKKALAAFHAAADEFVAAYPGLVEDAKLRLGKMYDAGDYPAPEQIRQRFSVSTRLVPIPSADDFRCQMGAEAMSAAKAALEESNRLALRAATLDAWGQARVAIAAMAEKLKAYHPASEGEKARGVFRDSLVSNVIEIAERLPGLNVADDPRLKEIAEAMGDKLTYYSAEELRNDDNAREATQSAAEKILAAIDATIATI